MQTPILLHHGPNFAWMGALNDGVFYDGRTDDTYHSVGGDVLLQDTSYGAPYDIRFKPKERQFSIWYRPRAEPFSDQWRQLVWQANRWLMGASAGDPVLVRVWRDTANLLPFLWWYIEARCDHIDSQRNGIDGFLAHMVAANPFWIGWVDSQQNDTNQQAPLAVQRGQPGKFVTTSGPAPVYTAPAPAGPAVRLITPARGTLPNIPPQHSRGGFQRVQYTAQRVAGQQLTPPALPYMGNAPTEPVITFTLRGNDWRYRYYRDFTITNNAPNALSNYPICLHLGDIHTLVGTKFHESGPGHVDNNGNAIPDGYLRDIRIETQYGARKPIYLRDKDPGSGVLFTHTDVRVWFLLYSLQPGETKTLRVLYNNPIADPNETYNELSGIKAMFNMYTSSNVQWNYSDFLPLLNQPESRAMQFHQYVPASVNLEPITYVHPAFINAQSTLVPCAGGMVMAHGATLGAAGLQLTVPVAINYLDYLYRISTNAKSPLVMRWQHRDGRWTDAPNGQAGYYADTLSTMKSTVTFNHNWTGGNTIYVDNVFNPQQNADGTQRTFYDVSGISGGGIPYRDHAPTGAAFVADAWGGSAPSNTPPYDCADYWVVIQCNDGSSVVDQVVGVNQTGPDSNPYGILTLSTTHAGKTADAGNNVQFHQYKQGDYGFPSADPPATFAWVLRGDFPQYSSGEWYFGAVEQLTIYYMSSEAPSIPPWSSLVEVDQEQPGRFQLKGTFGNPATGEYLTINTITYNTYDLVVVDCLNRSVTYYAFDMATQTYLAGVDLSEALSWPAGNPPGSRYYWIHIDWFVGNTIAFNADPDSAYNGADMTVDYLTLIY